jgi:3-hydroxy-9,10-secoandrosta-1,3,5(10)-triene-9,17-dione monooxygenase
MSSVIDETSSLSAPELIDRVRALRPLLRAQAPASERLTRASDEVLQACREAGVFKLYVPTRYGGYGLDPVTYLKVCVELARGDMSTGWGIALAAAHALQIASWWPQAAQDEIFAEGGADFRCPAVAAPVARAERVDGGWSLTGRVPYASGLPYSRHYMGQALIVGDGGETDGRMLLFVASSDQFQMLDDWGRLLGLKASGSNTVAFEGGFVPAHRCIEDALMVDFDVTPPTPGVALHGNPVYAGRAMALFTLTLAALAVGGAYRALDEYETMLDTKMSVMPPYVPRRHDASFQQWFGTALARIGTAEAAVINAGEQHNEICRRAVAQGVAPTYYEDWRLSAIGREAICQLWDVMQGELFRTAGSSAVVEGTPMVRVLHDMAMLHTHRNMQMREWGYGEIAREYLGLPRSGPGNVQDPRRR